MAKFSVKKLSGWTVKDIFNRNSSKELGSLFQDLEGEITRCLKQHKVTRPEDYLTDVYLVMRQDVQTYDFDRYPFGVFLHFVVNKAVKAKEGEKYVLHITKKERELMAKVKRYRQKEFAQFGIEPSTEEVAEHLGVDPVDILGIETRMNVCSLDTTVGEDEDGDRLVDMVEVVAESAGYQRGELRRDVRRCVHYLVRRGIVAEKVAEAFLDFYSPELEAMGIQELESIAYGHGYNSSASLGYHYKSVAKALLENHATHDILSSYLGLGA